MTLAKFKSMAGTTERREFNCRVGYMCKALVSVCLDKDTSALTGKSDVQKQDKFQR
jgi:hypothetical protein